MVREDCHPQCVSLDLVEAGGGAHFHHQCVSTLGGVGEGAHLHYPWSVSLYLEWRWGRGSFEPFTMSLPLPGMEVGEGLIYMSECLPLPWVEVGEGFICIIHRVYPSTLNGGVGVAHLYPSQCHSLYLGWR